MLTYTNISNGPLSIKNAHGQPTVVLAKGTITTHFIVPAADISIKWSVAGSSTWNPVESFYVVDDLTDGTPKTITLTDDEVQNTALVVIRALTGVTGLTVYFNGQANTPPVAEMVIDESFEMHVAQNLASIVLVPQGSGSCQVILSKEVR